MMEKHKSIFEDIAKNVDFKNFTVDKTKESTKGDNYMGKVSFLSIIDNSTKRTLHLVAKTAQTHEKFREIVPIVEAYRREVDLYNTIFPELITFQKERNVEKPFKNICKVYATSTDTMGEILVMEDLTKSGYKMWNRMHPMNFDHVALVMETYGRWHAASLAYKTLKPTKFENLTRTFKDSIFASQVHNDLDTWRTNNKAFFQSMYKTVEGNDVAVKYVEKLEPIFEKFILEEIPECQFVLTHGDCWCNNFMFKYEDIENPSKPSEVCVLDWQLSQLGSPVLDLSYFLFINIAQPELSKLDTFLDIYYKSLTDNLQDFDCNPSEVFPRNIFDQQWKKFAKYGLVVTYHVLKLVLGESEEISDFEQIADEDKDLAQVFNVELKRNDIYKKRIVDIVDFLAQRDLI